MLIRILYSNDYQSLLSDIHINTHIYRHTPLLRVFPYNNDYQPLLKDIHVNTHI
jgi:hypothetical protein